MYSAEDFCLWSAGTDKSKPKQYDMHPVWKKGGGASFEGGETNDYFTEVETL